VETFELNGKAQIWLSQDIIIIGNNAIKKKKNPQQPQFGTTHKPMGSNMCLKTKNR